jgi:hypothetical protein
MNMNVRGYNTRTKHEIHVPYSKLSFGQWCMKAKAGAAWNALSD